MDTHLTGSYAALRCADRRFVNALALCQAAMQECCDDCCGCCKACRAGSAPSVPPTQMLSCLNASGGGKVVHGFASFGFGAPVGVGAGASGFQKSKRPSRRRPTLTRSLRAVTACHTAYAEKLATQPGYRLSGRDARCTSMLFHAMSVRLPKELSTRSRYGAIATAAAASAGFRGQSATLHSNMHDCIRDCALDEANDPARLCQSFSVYT